MVEGVFLKMFFSRVQRSVTVNVHAKYIHLQVPLPQYNAINSCHPVYHKVRTLCKQGRLKQALNILNISTDSYAYSSLLQACLDFNSLSYGKLVHAHIILTGFNPDIRLETKLVTMYGECGSTEDAHKVFDDTPERDVVLWTAMITSHAKHGQDEKALALFNQMVQTGISPDHFTLASILPACAKLGASDHGKKVHVHIIRCGYESDVFVGSALVDMYVKCGSIEDAHTVFDAMPERNVVSWTAMIAGYAQNGCVDHAFELFQKMPERNAISWNAMIAACVQNGLDEDALRLFYQMQRSGVRMDEFTFGSLLAACANLVALKHGKEVHGHIIRRGFQNNVFLGSTLINMYSKCWYVEEAHKVFDRMHKRNVVLWTTMIAGYAQNGNVDEALKLFQEMPERNSVSWTTLVAGYARNGYFDEALKLFNEMPDRNIISWTAMVAGYARNGLVDEALKFFQKMPERNVVSWTAMIVGYTKDGLLDEALRVFETMPDQNVISWTAMIAGYAQNGRFDEALEFFRKMQLAGVKPNLNTFASVLPACANLAILHYGKEVHHDIIRNGFQSDLFVANALIDMYSKCGSIHDAYKIFEKMLFRDVVSWTAIILGYAMHGFGKEAIQLFEQMQLSGVKPDHVTFVGVLSACCHTGLVYDGLEYFACMSRDYHIKPIMEHYCCIVDLLGRAGRVNEAQDFVDKMPIQPDASVWESLLSICRMSNNIEIGENAADRLFECDPKNAAHYVLLSNMYAAAGRWDDVEKVRKLMRDRKVRKMPGCSWIEVNNKIYGFFGGDT